MLSKSIAHLIPPCKRLCGVGKVNRGQAISLWCRLLSTELASSRGVDKEGSGAYTVYVKNITVSVDDETYRRARIKAAQRDTSLSALVRRFLVQLASEESAERSLERRERDLRAQIRNFSAGDRLSREDVHVRRR